MWQSVCKSVDEFGLEAGSFYNVTQITTQMQSVSGLGHWAYLRSA